MQQQIYSSDKIQLFVLTFPPRRAILLPRKDISDLRQRGGCAVLPYIPPILFYCLRSRISCTAAQIRYPPNSFFIHEKKRVPKQQFRGSCIFRRDKKTAAVRNRRCNINALLCAVLCLCRCAALALTACRFAVNVHSYKRISAACDLREHAVPSLDSLVLYK